MITGPGLVVEGVGVRIEARRVAIDPVVEDVEHLLVARRRGRARAEDAAHDRPDGRAHVLGGGAVHDPDVVRELHGRAGTGRTSPRAAPSRTARRRRA